MKLKTSRDLSLNNIVNSKRLRTTDDSVTPVSTKKQTQQTPFQIWRDNVPLLYDSFVHNSLNWASLSCAFSKIPPEQADSHYTKQTILYSSRTDAEFSQSSNKWTNGQPSNLYLASVDIAQPNTTRRKQINRFAEANRSSKVSTLKKIVHPGEVNRIRTSPRIHHIVATHSDSPYVFIWDLTKQSDRNPHRNSVDNSAEDAKSIPINVANTPELMLTGHTAAAEYALEFAADNDRVLSGGSDSVVCLWDLTDNIQDDEDERRSRRSTPKNNSGLRASKLPARALFKGHTAAVEDVSFSPSDSGNVFCSVGDDKTLITWDARKGGRPAINIRDLHTDDINCCSWSPFDDKYILTGSTDKHISLVDIRMAGNDKKPIQWSMKAHSSSVLNVQWSPHDGKYFSSSGEDNSFCVWKGENDLLFNHCGHRAPVVDCDWSPHDPWTFITAADESLSEEHGGGSLQIWRISEFITKASDPEFAKYVRERLDKREGKQKDAAVLPTLPETQASDSEKKKAQNPQ